MVKEIPTQSMTFEVPLLSFKLALAATTLQLWLRVSRTQQGDGQALRPEAAEDRPGVLSSKEHQGFNTCRFLTSSRHLLLQKDEGVSITAIREIMLLRELRHENIVRLSSVHVNRAEPSLWLAFDYAEHDLFEMIRFHREQRENMRHNPTGRPSPTTMQADVSPMHESATISS